MKKFLLCWAVLCGALALGCVQAERRGVLDGAYISTARPAISVRAAQLPLLGNGRWHIQLADTDMVGGLPVRVWLAVYGAGAPQGPLAIVAHAEVPQGWFWDGASRRPFSVDPGVELLGDVGFQASTAIVRGPRDPFAAFAGADADKSGQPAAWLVRQFAARANFDRDKIVLEYREPLPAELISPLWKFPARICCGPLSNAPVRPLWWAPLRRTGRARRRARCRRCAGSMWIRIFWARFRVRSFCSRAEDTGCLRHRSPGGPQRITGASGLKNAA